MRRKRSDRLTAFILAVMVLPLLAACGDDDEPTNGDLNPLIGTWNAVSFEVDGVDLIDDGYSISFTFNSSSGYSLSISGDQSLFFCDSSTSCTLTGTYAFSSSTITFDPGDVEALTASYNITGSTMTLTATDDGTTIAAVLQRV